MHLRRMMEATATTTDLITTARTKAALRPTEIPTIMATTILTISRTSPARATTTTDRAEDTATTTTTTTALMIAAPASLGPAAPAASSKCASDEVISQQSLIKHQPTAQYPSPSLWWGRSMQRSSRPTATAQIILFG